MQKFCSHRFLKQDIPLTSFESLRIRSNPPRICRCFFAIRGCNAIYTSSRLYTCMCKGTLDCRSVIIQINQYGNRDNRSRTVLQRTLHSSMIPLRGISVLKKQYIFLQLLFCNQCTVYDTYLTIHLYAVYLVSPTMV